MATPNLAARYCPLIFIIPNTYTDCIDFLTGALPGVSLCAPPVVLHCAQDQDLLCHGAAVLHHLQTGLQPGSQTGETGP